MSKSANKPRNLMIELVEYAHMMRYADSTRKVPGQTILGLPATDRAILMELTSEDITDIRWPS